MEAEHIKKAHEWSKQHANHIVMMLVGSDGPATEPGPEDAPHPELYKDIHWRWIIENTDPTP